MKEGKNPDYFDARSHEEQPSKEESSEKRKERRANELLKYIQKLKHTLIEFAPLEKIRDFKEQIDQAWITIELAKGELKEKEVDALWDSMHTIERSIRPYVFKKRKEELAQLIARLTAYINTTLDTLFQQFPKEKALTALDARLTAAMQGIQHELKPPKTIKGLLDVLAEDCDTLELSLKKKQRQKK